MNTTTDTATFTMIDNRHTVTCYPVTFDGRRVTVHTPDGPRTRTRRNQGGYATAAALRAMGFADLSAVMEPGNDTPTRLFTTARD